MIGILKYVLHNIFSSGVGFQFYFSNLFPKLGNNILKSECFLDRLMYNVVSCFLYLVSVLDKACVANDLDLENKLKLRDYQRDICKQ